MTVNYLPAELTFWDEISKVWRIYELADCARPIPPAGCVIIPRPTIGVRDEDEAVGLSD